MADIRIKDLAVTAGSSASDDYLAVDGATNGTRKLSAYSPTFGGNLTVSGTGTSSFGGLVKATGNAATSFGVEIANGAGFSGTAQYYLTAGTGAGFTAFRLLRGNGAAGYEDNGFNADCWAGARFNLNALGGSGGNFTISGGNLTVSGTGTSSVAGELQVSNASALLRIKNSTAPGGATRDSTLLFDALNDFSGASQSFIKSIGSGNSGITKLAFGTSDTADATATERMRLTNGGNLLLKTDGIDSSNGKLQLAESTANTGGIGFGSDTSLYRYDVGRLAMNHIGGTNAQFYVSNSGTIRGLLQAYGTGSQFIVGAYSSGWSTIICSGAGTTALTLDSSQNATFEGRVKAGTAYGTAKSVEVNNAFIDQPQNTTKTVTVNLPQGVNGATFILDVGAYGNSGSGYGSLLIKGAGYLGSSTAYDAYEVVKVNSGNVTVSSVTKGNGQLTFTVINTAGTVSVSIKLTATAGDDITTIPAITIA